MSYKIIRWDLSPYFQEDFKEQEKIMINQVDPRASYHFWPKVSTAFTSNNLILITSTHTNLESIPSPIYEKIKLIIHPNSGYDNFSKEFVKSSHFPIIIGNPIRAKGVSQYIMSVLLGHYNPIPFSKKWDSKRLWDRSFLDEKEVTLIGYGHIGKMVEKLLRPFVKAIHIYDPYVKTDSRLRPADIIILAAGLNASSKNIIDQSFLNQLPHNAVIINSARGKLIDQNALLQFLSKNKEARAFLDVYQTEPYSTQEFNKIDNILTSSHIAGVSKNIDQLVINFEKEILINFIKGPESFKQKYSALLLSNRLNDDLLI